MSLIDIGPPLEGWRRPSLQRGVLARRYRENYVALRWPPGSPLGDVIETLTTAVVGRRRDHVWLTSRWHLVRREWLALIVHHPEAHRLTVREVSTPELSTKYGRKHNMAEVLISKVTRSHDPAPDSPVAALAESMRAEYADAACAHKQDYYETVNTVAVTAADGSPAGVIERRVPSVTGRARFAPTGVVHSDG